MKYCPTILRRLLSFVLICIFAFSITPVIVFHNMLAHHHDSNIEHHHSQSSEIAKAGINCHWDSLVCEGSFINNIIAFDFASLLYIEAPLASFYSAFFSQHHFYAELRGPPFSQAILS